MRVHAGCGVLRRALRNGREIHVVLPPDLYEALRERAAAEGVTLSMIVRRILRRGLG